jgi:hypothetical protein
VTVLNPYISKNKDTQNANQRIVNHFPFR